MPRWVKSDAGNSDNSLGVELSLTFDGTNTENTLSGALATEQSVAQIAQIALCLRKTDRRLHAQGSSRRLVTLVLTAVS